MRCEHILYGKDGSWSLKREREEKREKSRIESSILSLDYRDMLINQHDTDIISLLFKSTNSLSIRDILDFFRFVNF